MFFFRFFFFGGGGGGGSFESGGSTGCHRVGLCVCVRRVRGPAARPRTGWNWISFVLRRFSPLFLRWIRQGLSPYWGLSLLSSLRCRVYRHSAANNVKVIGPAAKKTLTTAENPVPEIRKKNDWPRRFAKNVKPTMSWLRFGFLRPVLWVVVEKKNESERTRGRRVGLDVRFSFVSCNVANVDHLRIWHLVPLHFLLANQHWPTTLSAVGVGTKGRARIDRESDDLIGWRRRRPSERTFVEPIGFLPSFTGFLTGFPPIS